MTTEECQIRQDECNWFFAILESGKSRAQIEDAIRDRMDAHANQAAESLKEAFDAAPVEEPDTEVFTEVLTNEGSAS